MAALSPAGVRCDNELSWAVLVGSALRLGSHTLHATVRISATSENTAVSAASRRASLIHAEAGALSHV